MAGWDLLCGAPTHKVTRLFDHVVLPDHVTNQSISTTTIPIAMKLSKVVT